MIGFVLWYTFLLRQLIHCFFLHCLWNKKTIQSRDFLWLVVLCLFFGRRSGPASMLQMVLTGKYHSLGHRLMEVNRVLIVGSRSRSQIVMWWLFRHPKQPGCGRLPQSSIKYPWLILWKQNMFQEPRKGGNASEKTSSNRTLKFWRVSWAVLNPQPAAHLMNPRRLRKWKWPCLKNPFAHSQKKPGNCV